MRRDAGADLRDAGVEVEMIVALVPEDLRLARQELGLTPADPDELTYVSLPR